MNDQIWNIKYKLNLTGDLVGISVGAGVGTKVSDHCIVTLMPTFDSEFHIFVTWIGG